jgi:hypothetical protein
MNLDLPKVCLQGHILPTQRPLRNIRNSNVYVVVFADINACVTCVPQAVNLYGYVIRYSGGSMNFSKGVPSLRLVFKRGVHYYFWFLRGVPHPRTPPPPLWIRQWDTHGILAISDLDFNKVFVAWQTTKIFNQYIYDDRPNNLQNQYID